ncbi:MAG: hypothetical protein Q9224_005472, partial [Gallowayella concinna]
MASHMMNVWGQLASKAIKMLLPYDIPKQHIPTITHITKTIVTEKIIKSPILITDVIKNISSTDVVSLQPSHAMLDPATKIAPASPATAQMAFEVSSLATSSFDWYFVGYIALLVSLFACFGLLVKYRKRTGSLLYPLVNFLLGAIVCFVVLTYPLSNSRDATDGLSDVHVRHKAVIQLSDILASTIQVALLELTRLRTLAFFAVYFLLRSILLHPSGKEIPKGYIALAHLCGFCGKCFRAILSGANFRRGSWGRIVRDLFLAGGLMLATFLITALKWVYPYLSGLAIWLWSIDFRGYTKGILQVLVEIRDQRGKARLQKKLDAGCQCPASVCANNVARIAADKSAMDAKDAQIARLTARIETSEEKMERDKNMHSNSLRKIDIWHQEQANAAKLRETSLVQANRRLSKCLDQARKEQSAKNPDPDAFKAKVDSQPCTKCQQFNQIILEVQSEKIMVEERLKESEKKLIDVSTENTELRKLIDANLKKSNDGSEGGCRNCADLSPVMEKAQHEYNLIWTHRNALDDECNRLKNLYTELQAAYDRGQETIQALLNEGNLLKYEAERKFTSCNEKLQDSQFKLTALQIDHSSCMTNIQTEKDKVAERT